jgi:MOSC domain-containing protein YiiM
MAEQTLRIDSTSVGDPACFRTLEELEQRLAALPPAPRDSGRVALIVVRREGGRRDTPDSVHVTPVEGVPGDAWGRQRAPHVAMQIAVMQRDVAEMIANGQALALAGDNLFVDLDLSGGNLPPGSRVRVGKALLEVTPMPHDGCRKFRARFGPDALRLVAKPELRGRNLRGIYLRVVQDGAIRCGDRIEVITRPGRGSE